MAKIVVILFILVCVHCIRAEGEEETKDRIPADDRLPPNVDPSSKISFESPKMSDEEQFSSHLPDSFKCDACTAIAYQVSFVFVYLMIFHWFCVLNIQQLLNYMHGWFSGLGT